MRAPAVLGTALVVLLLAAVPSNAQNQPDIRLVGQQVEDEGLVLSGKALVQVVLRGNGSDSVEEVTFSYAPGPTPPGTQPAPTALRDLRTDQTPSDGWMLPVNASRLPEGTHRFAIQAYAEAGNPASQVARLADALQVEGDDETPPWPWVLPGETDATTNPHREGALTVEIAEEGSAQLFLRGQRVPLEAWTPPRRDADLVPRATARQQTWGSGFTYDGNLSEGDVLRVVTTDTQGNRAGKGVLVGHGIDEPILEVSIPVGTFAVPEGSMLRGVATIRNLGQRATAYEVDVDAPEDWNASLSSRAGHLDPQQGRRLRIAIDVPANASTDPPIAFQAHYQATDGPVTSRFPLPLHVTPANASAPSDPPTVTIPVGLWLLPILAAGALTFEPRSRGDPPEEPGG